MKGHDYIFGNNHTHYNLNITHNLTFCDHSLFKIEHISKQFSWISVNGRYLCSISFPCKQKVGFPSEAPIIMLYNVQ